MTCLQLIDFIKNIKMTKKKNLIFAYHTSEIQKEKNGKTRFRYVFQMENSYIHMFE